MTPFTMQGNNQPHQTHSAQLNTDELLYNWEDNIWAKKSFFLKTWRELVGLNFSGIIWSINIFGSNNSGLIVSEEMRKTPGGFACPPPPPPHPETRTAGMREEWRWWMVADHTRDKVQCEV